MNKFECDASPDPVQRMVRAMSAKEIVDWMVESHGLPQGARETVERNLREQFKWHRLQGRLDRGGWLAFVATLFGLRQSPLALEKPETLWERA